MRLNTMQKILLGLAVLVLLGVGGYVGYAKYSAQGAGSGGAVACTMEAKLCPDGVTYVGRQGPKCEFAACPTATSTSNTVTLKAALNQTISAFNFSITPLSVTQDSRCPTDPGIRCIQAGTVQVKTVLGGDLGAYTATLELNKPLVNEQVSITLTNVAPAKISTHSITQSEYLFTFEIKKRYVQ